MRPYKSTLLSSTMVPAVMVAAGILTGCEIMDASAAQPKAVAANPCAAKNPCAARNPCAAKNPCNPCAAKNACNPCNPCNPCAASGGASAKCVIPRLQTAAAKNPCNPCAAKNPCNPCAAKNPCNPCAAKNPCNPCAAKNPCNPCAAKNPCNPCAAANPCNPCAASDEVELTKAEAVSAYGCLSREMQAGYNKSGNKYAAAFSNWKIYNTQPYTSGTHGGRFVNNYANAKAKAYGRYEEAGRMPPGSVLAKDSFAVKPNGKMAAGPLFLMEKMHSGFSRASGDWRYTLIMPSGQTVGVTGGKGSNNVKFCAECHMSVAEDQDSMLLLPDEVRRN